MFWVFCNTCYIRPGQGSKRQFFMTSCSHILCGECTYKEATECRRCHSPCMIVTLNSQMPDEVKEVFCDVNEKLSQLMKVLDYQEGNRTKLISHYRNVFLKYKGAKVYVNDLEKKFKIVYQKYESAKTAVLQLQSTVDALTKKCQWYKQKISANTPQLQSPAIRASPRPPPSIQFSPRNSQVYRSQTSFLSPESSPASTHWSSNSSGSYNGNGVFTPPANKLELLSLMNKPRRTPKL